MQEWQAVAKDGADLRAVQRAVRPAEQILGPGETIDFEVTVVTAGMPVVLLLTNAAAFWKRARFVSRQESER